MRFLSQQLTCEPHISRVVYNYIQKLLGLMLIKGYQCILVLKRIFLKQRPIWFPSQRQNISHTQTPDRQRHPRWSQWQYKLCQVQSVLNGPAFDLTPRLFGSSWFADLISSGRLPTSDLRFKYLQFGSTLHTVRAVYGTGDISLSVSFCTVKLEDGWHHLTFENTVYPQSHQSNSCSIGRLVRYLDKSR